MFVTIFWDIYENARKKNFINPSCPNHPKIIHWNKEWHKLLFLHFFVVPQKRFYLFEATKGSVKKNCVVFPFYSSFGKQGLWLYFWQTPTYAISVSLTIKIYKNNIDTSRINNKQCFKIILNTKTRLKVFIEQNWHFHRVTAKYCRHFPQKLYQTILFSLSDANLF